MGSALDKGSRGPFCNLGHVVLLEETSVSHSASLSTKMYSSTIGK